jgi:DNA-binding NarL/FixJ family response regulator
MFFSPHKASTLDFLNQWANCRACIMGKKSSNCAILADRNTAASDAVRGLLESEFDSVYVVANAFSLNEGVKHLRPRLVVLDQFVSLEALHRTLQKVHKRSPDTRVIVLVVRDHSMIAEAVLAAGADAVVLKRSAGKDLFEALNSIECGNSYASPGFGLGSHKAPIVRNEVSSEAS